MNATIFHPRDPAFRVITVAKETGLGLKILGGIDRNEGPLVYIHEVTPGGDCYKVGITSHALPHPKIANNDKVPPVPRFGFLIHQ